MSRSPFDSTKKAEKKDGSAVSVSLVSTSLNKIVSGPQGPQGEKGDTGPAGGLLGAESITELRSLIGQPKDTRSLRSRATINDGGGGLFVWDDGIGTDDDGTVVNSTGYGTTKAGVWRRVYSGPIDVRWFGAVGDGVTNSTTALSRALAAVPNGGSLLIPKGRFLSSTSLFPNSSTTIEGLGPDSILMVNDSRGIRTKGNHNINIINLTVDMIDPITLPRYGIAMDLGSTNCIIEKARIVNAGQYGIVVSEGYATVIGTTNSGGLIRLTLGGIIPTLTTGQVVTVENVGGTTEANGNWTITVISSNVIELQNSTFTSPWTSGGNLLFGGAGGHIVRNCLINMTTCTRGKQPTFLPVGIEVAPRGAYQDLPITITNVTNASGIIKLTFGSSIIGKIATGQKLLVDGVKGTYEANGIWTVTVVNSTNITLDNSTFVTPWTSGGTVNYGFFATPGIVIDSCTVLCAPDSMVAGMKISVQRGGRIVNNYIQNATSGDSPAAVEGGIDIGVGCHGMTVSGNHIYGCTIGISGGGQDFRARNNENILIQNNSIRGSIYGFSSTDGLHGLKIEGNHFQMLAGGTAVLLGTQAHDQIECQISNNYMVNGGISYNYSDGYNAPGLLISNNYITDPAGDAIDFDGYNTVVRGNTIFRPEQHGVLGSGDYAQVYSNKFINGNINDVASGSCIFVGGEFWQVHDNHGANQTGIGKFKYGINAQGKHIIARDNLFNNMVTAERNITAISANETHLRSVHDSYVDNTATTTLPNDTNEHDLKSMSIIPGVLTAFGGVRIRASGVADAGNSGSVDIRFYFGDSALLLLGIPADTFWVLDARVMNAAGEGAQQWSYELKKYTNSSGVFSSAVGQRGTLTANTATSTTIIKTSAQKTNGTDVFVQQMWDVDIIK